MHTDYIYPGEPYIEDDECTWTQSSENSFYEDDSWDTSCGKKFVFEADTPKDNGYSFCPACGKKLVQIEPDVREEGFDID
jgi:hypothetical protein